MIYCHCNRRVFRGCGFPEGRLLVRLRPVRGRIGDPTGPRASVNLYLYAGILSNGRDGVP
jgi:hypothetical protein